jgi:hypothetical protein
VINSEKLVALVLTVINSEKLVALVLSVINSEKLVALVLTVLNSEKLVALVLIVINSEKLVALALTVIDSEKLITFVLRAAKRYTASLPSSRRLMRFVCKRLFTLMKQIGPFQKKLHCLDPSNYSVICMYDVL